MSRIEKIGGRRERFSRRDYYIKADLGYLGIEYKMSSDYPRRYPCGHNNNLYIISNPI